MSMTLDQLSLVLVEPSQVQQIILREHLAQIGVRSVRVAPTMAQALTDLRAFTPHAVLSAMHLPDGKGHELLARIRQDEELAELAFLLVSSETRTHELEPIRQGGAVAIIPKPCTKEDLLRGLTDTLDLLTRDALDLTSQDVEEVRALVVDDSRTSRRFVIQTLRQLGIENVVEAADGLQAAEILTEKFFDLVVTDYNMPKMNGHELVEHIRTKSNQPSVPVLMITSERAGARISGVERAGVSAIVDKPFEINRVRVLLRDLLG